jgi:hypothetical protein
VKGSRRRSRSLAAVSLSVLFAVLVAGAAATSGASRKFYDDDPLRREPETEDASGAKAWDIDLALDLIVNLFGRPGDAVLNQRAGNLTTVDEVADSSWFTNRILARPLPIEEAVRGPLTTDGPAPGRWSVAHPKRSGVAPGFTMLDARGEQWFVSFDGRGFPEAATGAVLVANKIFWALGYWQIENHLIAVHPEQLTIEPTATVVPPSGKPRPMRRSDLDEVFRRAERSADGSYRAVAGRAVPGRPLGGFYYHGTRPDDPNDLVPHEHRRELRALKVFGAWTNLVDMKAGNTLDTVLDEAGRKVVRHYLQDVGSTFGTGAVAPREYDEGWEYLADIDLAVRRLGRFGFYFPPWLTARYEEHPAVGRFEGTTFDPHAWKPRVPTAAFRHARPDDDFWAARRVMAFSDELIRALVRTGRYSDPAAERILADVLIARRDRIGRAFLPAVNPLVGFALDAGGRLTFENAAVAAGVAKPPAGGYRLAWSRFDNATGGTTAIGSSQTASTESRAPSGLPAEAGTFVKVQVRAEDPAMPAWATPVDVYFRRSAGGWTLVGLERLP